MNIGPGFIWDDLLEYLDDRRVVPIIGWDLVHVDGDAPGQGGPDKAGSGTIRFDRWIARRMAQKLGMTPNPDAPDDFSQADDPLDVLVRQYEAAGPGGGRGGGHVDQLYPRLRSVLREKIATPEPLRQLARIEHFKLFVTMTFDGLLEQALLEERGRQATSLAFSLTGQDDLPGDAPGALGGGGGGAGVGGETVYHLLGKSSSTVPDCVLSQEQMLEYFHHLQRKGLPERLADTLRQSHLLFIGNRLTDWVVRMLLRIAKGERLIAPRGCSEIVADPAAGHEGELVVFLRSFSPSTQIFTGGNATAFVAELARRYAERHPARSAGTAPAASPAQTADEAEGDLGPTMPAGAVFISYASQDLASAQQLHAGLEAAGIDTWLDKRQLEAGEEFNLKIARSIRSCSLFIPVISANTQARVEGYFRQEWNLAAERAMRMDDSVRFILPVVVDGTPYDESLRVPARFRGLHWTQLQGGTCTQAFVEQVRGLVRDVHRRLRAGAAAGAVR